MSFYKLVQHLKTYVDSQKIKSPIVIRSRTARRWLCKLGYEYKNIRKDIFIDEHKRPDVIEDQKIFLRRIEELKPYVVEFENDRTIKPKIYLSDCAVDGKDC